MPKMNQPASPPPPNLPKFFQALDVKVLSRELTRVGFQVEVAELFEVLEASRGVSHIGAGGINPILEDVQKTLSKVPFRYRFRLFRMEFCKHKFGE